MVIRFIIIVMSLLSATTFADIRHLPVQEGGRIKPFDTFARENLSLLWGKESYKGQPATSVVLSWMLIPDEWDKTEFVLIRHSGLREALKLDPKRLYYSPKELIANDRLGLLIQELKNKRQAEEKLNPFDQAVQTLENQISAFHSMKIGYTLRTYPTQDQKLPWLNVPDLPESVRGTFQGITNAFVEYVKSAMQKNEKAVKIESSAELSRAVDEYVAVIEREHPNYFNKRRIDAEVLYNTSHPFRWAWISYLSALIFFLAFYVGNKTLWGRLGAVALSLGLIFHLWGFALRIYILERAPVTNMFETVAWVAFVGLAMALILYAKLRAKVLLVAASLVATFCLILCDVSSSVLDDTLTVLQPVLRDNFWLLTHVIIIVSSYAAFFVAFFIGDILLYYFYKDEVKYRVQIEQGVHAIYRSLQIGVVLLAAGTILGGVWADYSWGRFWGWDPKETWAFIALLGYLIILHGRIIGWLKAYGLAAASVVAFSLVIMAWYGVNFVLGAGLHTYGFGAGGVEYVAGFVALHLIAVVYVTTLRQAKLKQQKASTLK